MSIVVLTLCASHEAAPKVAVPSAGEIPYLVVVPGPLVVYLEANIVASIFIALVYLEALVSLTVASRLDTYSYVVDPLFREPSITYT
jgi:hypothetical protein